MSAPVSAMLTSAMVFFTLGGMVTGPRQDRLLDHLHTLKGSASEHILYGPRSRIEVTFTPSGRV